MSSSRGEQRSEQTACLGQSSAMPQASAALEADADFAAVDLEVLGADIFAAELKSSHGGSARAGILVRLNDQSPRPVRRMPFWEQPTPALADWEEEA